MERKKYKMMRLKKLAASSVMALTIATQCMMPVQAAEIASRYIERCDSENCNLALISDRRTIETDREYIGLCTERSHIQGKCHYERVTFVTYRVLLCPKGHCIKEVGVEDTFTRDEHIND